MLDRILDYLEHRSAAPEAEAHCDGPCGVYDPASARVAAEAVLSLTKKILALTPPSPGDQAAGVAFLNTVTRYVTIKEEQAHLAKKELLILWTDYFKPDHLKDVPNLHEMFWNANKQVSKVKASTDLADARTLLDQIDEIDAAWRATGGNEKTRVAKATA